MPDKIATDHPFSLSEQHVLRTLAGLVIPASTEYGVPGADDGLIFADILHSAVANAAEVQAGIHFALDAAPELGEKSAGDLLQDAEQLSSRLSHEPTMAALVSLVLQCYYRDDRVLQALGMEARPPFPQGFEVETGDWSMLAPVQQRGKLWRDA